MGAGRQAVLTTPKETNVIKAFNQFLVDLNDGSTHAGLTGDLAELREQSGYQVLLGTP